MYETIKRIAKAQREIRAKFASELAPLEKEWEEQGPEIVAFSRKFAAFTKTHVEDLTPGDPDFDYDAETLSVEYREWEYEFHYWQVRETITFPAAYMDMTNEEWQAAHVRAVEEAKRAEALAEAERLRKKEEERVRAEADLARWKEAEERRKWRELCQKFGNPTG